jgi:hypothetical protein
LKKVKIPELINKKKNLSWLGILVMLKRVKNSPSFYEAFELNMELKRTYRKICAICSSIPSRSTPVTKQQSILLDRWGSSSG